MIAASGPISVRNIPFSFLLDDYPGALYACSMNRKLSSAYAGSAFRIRDTTTNTEYDIAFTGNEVADSSITTVIGSNSAALVKIYDQSGNGLNWIQPTATKQPLVVVSGTIQKVDGFISPLYDGVDAIMYVDGWTTPATTGWQAFMVIKINKDGIVIHNALGNGGSSRYFDVFINGSGSNPYDQSGTPLYFKNNSSITATRDSLYDNFINQHALLSVTNLDLNNIGWTGMYDSYGTGLETGGNIGPDRIMYDNSTNTHTDIGQNIKDYYGFP